MATPRVVEFEIEGADGRPIKGNLHSAADDADRRPTVVMCHGFKGFKDWGMFPFVASRLARAGFTAMRFNFSGAGVSDGDVFDQPERFRDDTYSNQIDDLGRALDWVDEPAVGVLGHSRGGGVAVLRAARDTRIASLVTWASVATTHRWDDETVARWRDEGTIDIVNARTGQTLPLGVAVLEDLEANRDALDVLAAAGRVTRPWLIVHGTDDESVPVEEAHLLARSAADGDRELRVIDGGTHTFGARHEWTGPTPQLDEAINATVRFFSRTLLGGGQ